MLKINGTSSNVNNNELSQNSSENLLPQQNITQIFTEKVTSRSTPSKSMSSASKRAWREESDHIEMERPFKKRKSTQKKELNEEEHLFIEASKKGDLIALDFNNLKPELNVNVQDASGTTALMHLSGKGRIADIGNLDKQSIASILKERGAFIDQEDKEGRTALLYAALFADDPISSIAELIKLEADLFAVDSSGNNFYDICNTRKLWGKKNLNILGSALHSRLETAITKGDYDLFKKIIKSFGFMVKNYKDKLFSHAIKGNNVRFANLLLKNGVNINSTNMFLLEAIQHEHVKMVKFLIDNGADVNCFEMETEMESEPYGTGVIRYPKEYIPLKLAMELENTEIINLLLKNNINTDQIVDGKTIFENIALGKFGDYTEDETLRILTKLVDKNPDCLKDIPVQSILKKCRDRKKFKIYDFIDQASKS